MHLLATLFALAALGIAFANPYWSWVFVALPELWLWYTLRHARRRMSAKHVTDLSPTANALLQKYAHYYQYPHAGQSYSSAASTLAMVSLVVAVISGIKREWISVGIGVVNYFVAAMLARGFNPGRFLVDQSERDAHNEIADYLTRRQREAFQAHQQAQQRKESP